MRWSKPIFFHGYPWATSLAHRFLKPTSIYLLGQKASFNSKNQSHDCRSKRLIWFSYWLNASTDAFSDRETDRHNWMWMHSFLFVLDRVDRSSAKFVSQSPSQSTPSAVSFFTIVRHVSHAANATANTCASRSPPSKEAWFFNSMLSDLKRCYKEWQTQFPFLL